MRQVVYMQTLSSSRARCARPRARRRIHAGCNVRGRADSQIEYDLAPLINQVIIEMVDFPIKKKILENRNLKARKQNPSKSKLVYKTDQ